MENMGLNGYMTNVFFHSITINLLHRRGILPYDYHSYPWERSADYYGNVNRGYLKYADPLASYYWHQVELISRATLF